MPFRSKAQQRWAFANHKPWARRWAHETRSIKSLPARRSRSRGKRRSSRKR